MRKSTRENRKKFLEELKVNPNVSRTCKKTGIARATYYRWLENKDFASAVSVASPRGQDNMNDFVEDRLTQLIQNGSLGAIKFYLSHNHPKYRSYNVRDIEDMKWRLNEYRQIVEYAIKDLGVEKVLSVLGVTSIEEVEENATNKAMSKREDRIHGGKLKNKL